MPCAETDLCDYFFKSPLILFNEVKMLVFTV